MFENLSERIASAFKQIKGEGRITDLNIANTIKDIRKALLDADVNFKIAKEFTDKGKLWVRYVSPTPATKVEVLNLKEMLEKRLD